MIRLGLAFFVGVFALSSGAALRADTLIATQTFSFAGSVQNYTIPSGVNYIQIKAWGAGGGGDGPEGPSYGGGGGFTSASYSVTPGQVVHVVVGGGGYAANSYSDDGGGYGGYGSGAGGDAGDPWGSSGGGGGGTQVNVSNFLNVFAGGGGGSSAGGYGSNTGGAGGGANGQAGIHTGHTWGGGGATQSGPGVGTVVSGGSPIFGTSGDVRTIAIGNGGAGGATPGQTGYQAAGGGGGFYGGAMGDVHQAPGGGGSGIFTTTNLLAGTGVTTTGSGSTPAGTGDADYPGGGIAGGNHYNGSNGYVIIRAYYSPPPDITSATTQIIARNQATSYQITASNSPVSFGASSLPPGLSVNTSTGVISGTPTTAGTYSATVSATNSGATGTATVTWTVLAPANLTDSSDFESGSGYSTGDVIGQQLWLGTPSLATVSTDQAQGGSRSLKLAGNSTPATATKYFSASGSPGVTYVSLYVRPVAATSAANSSLIQTESAQVGFQIASGQGEIYAFDGVGANHWVATGVRFDLNASNQATGWLHLTIREDYTHHTWDLYADSTLIDYDLAFGDTSESYFRLLTLKGHASAAAYFDTIVAQAGNPLFTDADNDGMADSWETANGLSTSTDDRNSDHDGDGRTNIEEYFAGTAANNADVTVPTAPTVLHIGSTTPTSASISWSGAVDTGAGTNGIAGYNVYRNGVKLNSSLLTGTGFADTGLTAGSTYTYTIRTVDLAGNVSGASAGLTVVTPTSSSSGSLEVFTPLP
ncbi:MAG TPA: putative Ig domain-containing protein [Opitutaceae bacterium]|nr:putative Ig domain-containing protein [Opitutaceae bacterium]